MEELVVDHPGKNSLMPRLLVGIIKTTKAMAEVRACCCQDFLQSRKYRREVPLVKETAVAVCPEEVGFHRA